MKYLHFILTCFFAILLLTATAQKTGTGSSTASAQPSVGSGGGSTTPQPDVDKSLIPQTPDVAAFSKYGDVPVNLSRGMANVSIPILNTTIGQLPVDISLSYAYNGYKPQETPGWTGLGWTLNAGGVITRTVRGMVDEDNTTAHVSNGTLDDTPDMSWFQNNQPYLAAAGQYQRDAEPDIYSYNFPGHSGSFILKNGRAVTFPYDNIKIIKTGSTFLIWAEDGTYYQFNTVETTWTKLSQGMSTPQSYATAWHLSETMSADHADILYYTYTAVSYIDYSTVNSQQATYSNITGGYQYACGAQNASGNPLTRINGWQLSGIQNRSQSLSISFTLDQSQRQDMGSNGNYFSLKSIQVFNSAGTAIKQVQFSYDYFKGSLANNHIPSESYKLKLKQVTVTSSLSGTTTNSSGLMVYPKTFSYQFDYENENDIFPSNATNGLDIYGYYNGANGNGNLAFSTPMSVMPLTCATSPGNDRTPILAYCKYGSLSKITYPTGGYTKFSYELNPGPGTRVRRYSSTDPLTGTTSVKLYGYTLNGSMNSSVQFLDGAQFYTPFDHYQMQDGNNNNGSPYTQYTANLNAVAGYDYFRLDPQPMYYSLVTETDSGAALHKTTYEFNAYGGDVTDVYQTSKTEYKQTGSTFAALHSQILNYSIPAGLKDTSVTGVMAKLDNVSNLALFPPNNADNTSRSQLFRGESYGVTSMQRILTSENETLLSDDGTITQGNPHFYYYDNPLHRQLTREAITDSEGDSIFTQYTYPADYPAGSCDVTAADRQFKTDLEALHTAYTNCVNSRQLCTSGASSCYNNYPCETNAFTGFPAIVQTWTNNKNAYNNCLQAAINAEADLNLKAIKTMQQLHIVNKTIEKIVYRKKAGQSTSPTLLSAVRTEYTLTPAGVPVPKAIWSTETYLNATLDQFMTNKAGYYKRRVNMIYDNTPNLIEQHKENDAPESYIWDVQDKHQLMAQVKNALPGQCAYASFENGQTGNWTIVTGGSATGDGLNSYTSFSGKVSDAVAGGGSYTLSVWQKTGQTLTATANSANVTVPPPILTKRGWNLYIIPIANAGDEISVAGNFMDEIRLYPAGALMTTYGYVPGVGVSLICDANNRYTFYEYDALSRLLQIRDADSNIIKRYDYQYSVPSNSNPLWTNTGTASCETNAGGQITGYQLVQQADLNPQSPGYGSTRTTRVFNNTACPSTTCTASSCSTSPDRKCVYGACETGNRFNTSTSKQKGVPAGSKPWVCTYHYVWSDGTVSQDYQDYGEQACVLGDQ